MTPAEAIEIITNKIIAQGKTIKELLTLGSETVATMKEMTSVIEGLERRIKHLEELQ